MSELTRAFAGDYQVRADREGRTISGIVVPFGVTARVSDGGPAYDEAFQRGAFAKTIAERGDRVKLLYQHNSLEPIGRATMLREDAAGLYGEFQVSAVVRGDEAIALVDDGVIDSFSVGFTPVKHTMRQGVKVRTEVAMREASLVTFPAYADARVAAIRAAIAALGVSPDDIDDKVREFLASQSSDPTGNQPGSADHEPASTRDVSAIHRSLRLLAREKGAL